MRGHLDVDELRGHVGEHHALDVLPLEAGEHQLFVGVFEIHREQAVMRRIGRARHREVADEVAVVAELLGAARPRSASSDRTPARPPPPGRPSGSARRRRSPPPRDGCCRCRPRPRRSGSATALSALARLAAASASGLTVAAMAATPSAPLRMSRRPSRAAITSPMVGLSVGLLTDILGFFIGARPREHFPHGNLLQIIAKFRLFRRGSRLIAVP